MGPVPTLARRELRTRWLALLGLVALVALTTAVLLTAVVGARRTASSFERFRAKTAAADAGIQTITDEESATDRALVATVPHVQVVTTRDLINGFPNGADQTTPDFAIYTDASGIYGTDLDRPLVLRGRMPDPDAPDEILLDELAASTLHLDVGDHVHVTTWSPADLQDLTDGGGDFPGFNGPPLDLDVVGVGRTSEGFGANVQRASLVALAGPHLREAHPGLGAWPPLVTFRVDDPERDLPAVRDVVSAGQDSRYIDIITAEDKYGASVRRSVGTLATGLWIFAAVAGVAAMVVVAQAVSRQVATAAAANEPVRAIGMSRWGRAWVSVLPALVAATIGAALGVVLAIALSPLLPTGTARRVEPAPGLWIDPLALVVGALLIAALLVGWMLFAGFRAQHPTANRAVGRPSAVARTLASWGARPSIVTGVRNTFERRDSVSVPVRSALVAAAIAVTGLVGAGVVIASLHELQAEPTRWGWTWSAQPDAFDQDPTDRLVADDRIEAVAVESSSSILVNDVALNGFAMDQRKGAIDFTVLSGRLPQSASEMTLDPRMLPRTGAAVGDVVHASLPDGSTRDLTVVGTTVVPDDSGTVGNGVLTVEGLQAAAKDEPLTTTLLRYPRGTDAAGLEQALSDEYDISFGLFTHPQPPGPVLNVEQGRGVAFALAGFFLILGVAGLFHALTLSTRRRRAEFSVLRAMGFRRRQVRRSVFAQAITIVAVGLAVGVPIGLLVGRAMWDRMLADVGVVPWATTPWLLLAVIGPAAVVLAVAVGWIPARAAARAPTLPRET
jgi:ABC-type lipoprotein release transport system permease subunit